MQVAALVKKQSEPEDGDTKFNSLARDRDDSPNALAGVMPTRVEIFRPNTREDAIARRGYKPDNDDLQVRNEVRNNS